MSLSGTEKGPALPFPISLLVEFISICPIPTKENMAFSPLPRALPLSPAFPLNLDTGSDELSADRAEEAWREKYSCSVSVWKLLLEGGKWCDL